MRGRLLALALALAAKIGSSCAALFEPAPRTGAETKFIDPTADL